MAYTLQGVALPYGLLWVDEHEWTPVAQSQIYSLTGALILETAVKLAGRPITLSGAADRAWITQATLDALRALLDAEIAALLALLEPDPMTLITPDGRSFSVAWNHNGPPISATPIKPRWPGDGEKYGLVALKLLEV